MRYSLYQEFYKLIHKKVTWIAPVLMFLLMLLSGLAEIDQGDLANSKWWIMSSFGVSQFASLMLIMVASSIFSMEFQDRTILTLLYKASSRIYVYFSKFVIVFVYNIFLHVFAICSTLILNIVLPKLRLDLFDTYQYHQSLLSNIFSNSAVDLFTTMLLISIIFLTSCLVSENSVVVIINLSILFFGQGISNVILGYYHHFTNIFRWNPLNLLNLTWQYANYSGYRSMTMLSNFQLVSATLVYIMLFFTLGYLVFRRKHY